MFETEMFFVFFILLKLLKSYITFQSLRAIILYYYIWLLESSESELQKELHRELLLYRMLSGYEKHLKNLKQLFPALNIEISLH